MLTTRRGRAHRCAAAILVITLARPVFSQQQTDPDKELIENAARTFVQAEVQSYAEKLLNQNPPIGSSSNFGTDAVFALQLILSADSYARAENDQQRFKSVLNGAAAYLGYVYAANPAVGLIAQAVLIVVGIIEGAVASSYYERMLEIRREMLTVQARIVDLLTRRYTAMAGRFAAALDDVSTAATEIAANDEFLRRKCDKFDGADFDRLGQCVERVLSARVRRERYISALEAVVRLPDEVFEMLKTEPDKPKLSKEVLLAQSDTTAKQVEVLRHTYDKVSAEYRRLVVERLTEEAIKDLSYQAHVRRIESRCSINADRLGTLGTRIVLDAARLRQQESSSSQFVQEVGKLRGEAARLQGDFEAMKLTCSQVHSDARLRGIMTLTQNSAISLVRDAQ